MDHQIDSMRDPALNKPPLVPHNLVIYLVIYHEIEGLIHIPLHYDQPTADENPWPRRFPNLETERGTLARNVEGGILLPEIR